MKKQTIFYLVIGIAALIFAAGFLLSQYIEYKQYRLSQQKAIEDCIEKTTISRPSGYILDIPRQCEEKFSK